MAFPNDKVAIFYMVNAATRAAVCTQNVRKLYKLQFERRESDEIFIRGGCSNVNIRNLHIYIFFGIVPLEY